MKRIFLAVVMTSLVITSCGQSKRAQAEGKAELVATQASAVVIEPTIVGSEQFIEEVIDYRKEDWIFVGDQPVVIDFYATWCPPCKKLNPVLVELATEYEGRVKFYKVDVDKEPEIANAFGIQSMPTMFYIPLNGELKRSVGYMPKHEIAKIIEDYLMTE